MHVMGVGGVGPSRTSPAEQDVKWAPDTVAVEEERYIAPPSCTIMPTPECEPRWAKATPDSRARAEV